MLKNRNTLVLLALLCALLALVVNAPGQISLDTVTQLYEASTRHSVSWQPPFLSAMLVWLGGGLLATTLFVAINAVLTYGSYALLVHVRQTPAPQKLTLLQLIVGALLILNPLVLAYTGIVWKDVLFGSWILASFTACVFAERASSNPRRLALLAGICLLLGAGSMIRQQGIVVGPLLLIAPILLVFKFWKTAEKWLLALGAIGLFTLASFTTSWATNQTIPGNAGRNMSVGPVVIQFFDLAGIVSRLSPEEVRQTLPDILPEEEKKLREGYSASRADFLDVNGLLIRLALAREKDPAAPSIGDVWKTAVLLHPMQYAAHRASVMSYLLDFADVNQCLPTHIGILGIPEQMKALGLPELAGATLPASGRMLYSMERVFFDTPVWNRWFYVLVLIVLTIVVLIRKQIPHRASMLVYLISMGLFVCTFIPAAIACDFRYLYPIIPSVTGIALLLLIQGRSNAAAKVRA